MLPIQLATFFVTPAGETHPDPDDYRVRLRDIKFCILLMKFEMFC